MAKMAKNKLKRKKIIVSEELNKDSSEEILADENLGDRPNSYQLPAGEHETPFTIESLKRRKQAEQEQYRLKGHFDDQEAAKSVVMKPSDPRKGYLRRRLAAILDSRPQEEAERIRS